MCATSVLETVRDKSAVGATLAGDPFGDDGAGEAAADDDLGIVPEPGCAVAIDTGHLIHQSRLSS